MTIDRRAFVAGTALVVVAPGLGLLPMQAAASAPTAHARNISRVVFMIEGWSARDDGAKDDEVWIRIGHSWRTAWR
jgi:hypothetical protein